MMVSEEILFDVEEKMEKVFKMFCDEMRVVVDYRLKKNKELEQELLRFAYEMGGLDNVRKIYRSV